MLCFRSFWTEIMSVDYNEPKEFRYRRKPRAGDGRPEFNTYNSQRQTELSNLLNRKPYLGELRREEAKETRTVQRSKEDVKFHRELEERRKEREQRIKRLETYERKNESRASNAISQLNFKSSSLRSY